MYKVQGGRCKYEISLVWGEGGVEGLALGRLGIMYGPRNYAYL